jgi:hypothetical protein
MFGRNPAGFASKIRELIIYLETENWEQADLCIDDGMKFLVALLTPQESQSKSGSLSVREPIILAREFGTERVRETLFAFDSIRMAVANRDGNESLIATRSALEKWEWKPTPEAQGDQRVTLDQEAVLRLLADGLKLHRAEGGSRLEKTGYVFNCPGGIATIRELVTLGYVDDHDNLTDAGRAIAKSLIAAQREAIAKKAAAASARVRSAKARAKRKEGK